MLIPNDEAREWLSIPEVAAYLGRHRDTIARWIREGVLPAYEIAGTRIMLIKPEDLENLIRPVEPDRDDPSSGVTERYAATIAAGNRPGRRRIPRAATVSGTRPDGSV